MAPGGDGEHGRPLRHRHVDVGVESGEDEAAVGDVGIALPRLLPADGGGGQGQREREEEDAGGGRGRRGLRRQGRRAGRAGSQLPGARAPAAAGRPRGPG